MDEGRLLAGRYRLLSVVGRGGMGTVWRALDETLDREVAVKEVLLPSGLSDEERHTRHQRTLREARASARLNHPGVVTVHDVVDEDDRPWIVMELVQARSLQEIVDEDGPLPPGRVAEVGRQIIGALRAAHAIGILHRDVKPANVLVAADDRAVLTDFGIAQMAGDATLTGTGLIMGSPAYMPPERVNGDRAIPASDLWALGATLYAACEGKAPHHRSDAMAVLAAVMTQDVPPPRNAGPLAPVLLGLLERDPVRRMGAERAEEALAAIASGHAADQAAAQLAWSHATAGDTAAAAGPWTGPSAPPPHVPDQDIPVPDMTAHYPPATAGQQWTPMPGGPGTTGVAPKRRSPVLPILAGAVVLAAAVAAAVVFLWPHDSGRTPEPVDNNPVAQGDPSGQGRTSPPASQNPSPSPSKTWPAGLNKVNSSNYSIGVPPGWTKRTTARGAIWSDPATKGYIQVEETPWEGDPVQHWKTWEKEAIRDGNLANFKRVAPITSTSVAGYPAADIQFTWTRSSGLTHALDRGVIVNGHSYAVVVALPESQWNANGRLVKDVLGTFQPAGVG
ncbi:serine/threonine-protein kinase [Actinomadura verrucosospora]|uniref:non-specific serine/threonine protein kinase n=1 Tax=Actinomadura verrucosospora TaxID=46165 RepID=A0A7D3VXT1_ACTVE|nr:serine/threonine-protein kinase [Actinomadura verrucosospora]QKG25270.1 serine/threonine protein kinase [Actinomadura verrucosospora]